ncbi:MAG TPA: hypothetical protein VFP84_32295 [Kofleriaceae bacterium]|nr:hypothetical protein [Kofleriaceae bacterium]
MIGPVTKNALLGVTFGVITLTVWAALSRQMALPVAALLGFCGGLTGGVVWGAMHRVVRGHH